MSRFDRVLVAPTAGEIEACLRDACRVLEDGYRQRIWPLNAVLRRIAAVAQAPEGDYLWGDPPAPRSTWGVRLVWWSDALGRRHVRVFGRRQAGVASLDPRWPGRHNPFLWGVYPEHCVFRQHTGRDELLVVCPCGVVGTPGEVAWMGRECGPCHDRREAGTPPPQPWALPRYTEEGGRVGFAGDGATVLTDDRGRLVRWEPATGRTEATRLHGAWAMALAPGGEVVVARLGPAAACYVEVYTFTAHGLVRQRELPRWPEPVGALPTDLTFTRDGRWLVGHAHQRLGENVWAWRWPDGVLVLQRVGDRCVLGMGAGRLVLINDAGTRLEVTDLDDPGPEPRTILWPGGRGATPLAGIALVGDGEAAVLCDRDGGLAQLELATGRVVARHRLDRCGSVTEVAAMPEGDGVLIQARERTHLVEAVSLETWGVLHGGQGVRGVPPACNGHWLATGAYEQDRVRLLPWPPVREYLRRR